MTNDGRSRVLTLVFTDVEGSTRFLREVGDDPYADILDAQRKAFRTVFESEHGREVSAEGDSLFFAFESASAAVRASVAALSSLRAQPWPAGRNPRVRVGIHMGEVTQTGSELQGLAVHQAARICEAARGGQILASRAVADIAARRLPDDFSLVDVGNTRLKGLEPMRLVEVRHRGLVDEEPSAEDGPIRVIFAEDNYLVREGTAALLAEVKEIRLIAVVEDLDGLLRAVAEQPPDVVLTDIRMPPTHTTEGIQAATRIRAEHPDVAVVLISQYIEYEYVRELLESGASKIGYLLKERVRAVDELVDALRTVCAGGLVLDPKVAHAMVASRDARGSPIARLTDSERQVLERMAEGKTNAAIASNVHMSERSVERHINSIFAKLALSEEKDVHRRVRAVLAFLESSGRSAAGSQPDG